MGSCGVIRSNTSVTPINHERLDVAGCIHRYNFGWTKTTTVVTDGSYSPSGGGVVLEVSDVQVSGTDAQYTETTEQSILPPGFDAPVPADTSGMGAAIPTFCKTGTRTRAVVRTRGVGTSEVITLGTVPYGVHEKKHYPGAILKTSGGSCPAPPDGTMSVGRTMVMANGVATETVISG